MQFHVFTICVLVFAPGGILWGATGEPARPAITLEKAVVDQNGVASLGVRLASMDPPFAAAQMDLRYPDQVSDVSITRGTDLDPGKTIATRVLGANVTRVLIYGLNRDPLRDGVIATVAVKLKPGTAAGIYSIELSDAIGADSTGHAVSLPGSTGAAVMPGAGVPTPAVSAVANAASYSRGVVAPGEIVVIGGEGLAATGEVVRASAAGTIGPSLAGVRVLFDGIPAPLLYVSATQLSAVVPYAMEGRNRAVIQVESQGLRSAAASVPVVRAAPGIFTLNQSGAGPGAIVNQDGTVNGTAHPAPRGSIIAIFGTGEGQTEPAGVDGMIVSLPDLRRPALPVSASIGGAAAEVTYAGSAPGQVAGLFQVNLRVPETTVPGGSVPVTIRVGDSSSQAGVTVEVK